MAPGAPAPAAISGGFIGLGIGLTVFAPGASAGFGVAFLSGVASSAAIGAGMGGIGALRSDQFSWAEWANGTTIGVLWEHGSKAIEDFKVGERVWARNEYDVNAPVELKAIEELFVRTGRILNLHVPGQVIRTTGEHPFYEYTKGWVPASELRPGDRLSSHDGQWVAVEEVYDTGEFETVHNLRVADFHTYFVGCEDWGFSVWAHNTYLTDEQKVAIAKDYQEWRTQNPKARSSEFFSQVSHPVDGTALGSGQIKAIKQIANNDPNWTRPGGQRGPQPASAPIEDQRQNVKVAQVTSDLTAMGHDIVGGGRYINENGIPVKLGAETVLPGIGRRPDITAYGPVGPSGPVPVGTQGPGIVTMEYQVNVGPTVSVRNGGGPTTVEQAALTAMQDAGHTVFYYGYGTRNR